MRHPAVWIPIVVIVLLLAVFHDTPFVLALWNVLDATNNALTKTKT